MYSFHCEKRVVSHEYSMSHGKIHVYSEGSARPRRHKKPRLGILRMSGIVLGNNDRLEKQQTEHVLVAVL